MLVPGQKFLAHSAVRGSGAKTVMPDRKIQSADGFADGIADGFADGFAGPGTAEDRQTLDHLFSITYEELRRLASSVKGGDPSATLNPTALVNEAWVKLARSPRFAATSRLHFKRIAARAMRQILVEAARRRNADKRGGLPATLVTFDESVIPVACERELLGLDTALDDLSRVQPRQAMMVESRFFGGLEIAEIAILLDVSEATILRDWRAAKAWLGQELRKR
jgi:RNA polymerase sigma factor (TIGR02999 family)